MRFGHTQTTTL